MMKKRSLLICLLLCVAFVFGCGGKSETADGDAETLKLSWWIPAGADSSYYSTYEENPCMKYVEQTRTTSIPSSPRRSMRTFWTCPVPR